jgi:hypothetical protein
VSGDSSVLLEVGKEAFYQVSGFVNLAIVVVVDLPACLLRDHGGFSRCLKHVYNPFVGIVSFVGEQHGSLHGRQKMIGAIKVVRLAA